MNVRSSEGRLVLGQPDDDALTEQLLSHIWRPSRGFNLLLAISGIGTAIFLMAATYTLLAGIGTWGNNIPAGWALGITNFVWWIGIGHAGTFISAILLLLEQRWRASINRFAEAMTLFAVMCAGMFPLLHLGRAWFFYWLIPYPSTMGVWPQFRSALTWDVVAVTTYFTVSLLFWYVGLIPDLAAARDRAPRLWMARIYGLLALGWRGSVRHWEHHRVAYGLLAGISTPLVLSVHSVISLDFSTGIIPGWHSTIFPPFFVVGAIHSGFAMVLLLLLPARAALGFDNVVTSRHLDAMATLLLTTGCIMGYCYLTEEFSAWYSGDRYEIGTMLSDRPFGQYGWMFWGMVLCNVAAPMLFWSPRLRTNTAALLAVSVLVLIGMWLERFVIIVQSLTHDFLPKSWSFYEPTIIDGTLYFGTISLFLFCFLLFLRFLPFIPLTEVKELVAEHPDA